MASSSVSYAAYKAHYSLFPASGEVVKALGSDIQPYLAGEGTIRFPASRPIPMELVTRVVNDPCAGGRRPPAEARRDASDVLPRLDSAITLADGRQLAYAEWGDREASRWSSTIHGMPASRLFCPDEESTIAAGVRLITI